MVYGKEKLVPDEQLEAFLDELSFYWEDEEWSVKKIAKEMRFGEPEPVGYPNLKPHHVYYFVQRYGKTHRYEMTSRRKAKPKPVQVEPKANGEFGVPHARDMPFEVVNYLRGKGWLLE